MVVGVNLKADFPMDVFFADFVKTFRRTAILLISVLLIQTRKTPNKKTPVFTQCLLY